MTTLIHLKLTDGTELIAKLIEERSDEIVVSDPQMAVVFNDGQGPAVKLMNWLMLQNPRRVPINRNCVAFCTTNIDYDLERGYLQTVSGIALHA